MAETQSVYGKIDILKEWKPRESDDDIALRRWLAMQARCKCKPELGIQAGICRPINSLCCREHCPRIPF